MRLSPTPDLSDNRRLVLAALVVTLVVGVTLSVTHGDISTSLGDTDDAMRLVMVRDLLAGHGWYDQWISRLQPPIGTYMHWSRLLDGAIAAMTWAFRLLLSPSAAESATRFTWPLLWIFPVTISALVIARRIGGASAAFVCALLVACDLQMFVQFRPGRIDHHNVQISLAMISAACAVAGGRRVAWAAGAATGLGLAIGIEALPFHALIGLSFGLRCALDREQAGSSRAYGLALLATSAGCFLLQTPPWRWSLSVCDAMGLNLIAAIGLATIGLTVVACFRRRLSTPLSLALLALVGLIAVGAYLALDPLCIRGPFAAVDPRVRPFWFSLISELTPWPRLLISNRVLAVSMIAGAIMMSAAAALLLLVRRRLDSATLTLCAVMALAIVAAANAARQEDYMLWFGIPVLSAACALVAERRLSGLMLPTVLLTLAVSPVAAGGVAQLVDQIIDRGHSNEQAASDHCFDTAVYRSLAGLPPGVVVADIDFGSYVLANTPSSAMAAPYHRMTPGILASHEALSAPPDKAEARFRALKAGYLVDCPTHPLHADARGVEAYLRRGGTPNWLTPLSSKDQVLQIYRVKPPGPSPSAP